MKTLTEADVYKLLEGVVDPEIPVVSLVDLGVVHAVEVDANGYVFVEMTPTFAGCPAINYMRADVEKALEDAGVKSFNVSVNSQRPWSSNHITPRGRQKLKEFGLAPPPAYDGDLTVELLEHTECPHCGSTNTQLVTPFGPTLCRAMHKCHNCGEAFEQFKPL